MAYIGTSPSQGVRHRYLFTATSGQTTFTGSDDDSRTLSYTDTKFMDVFLNGVLLDPNSDYTATTGTSIVLTSGASAGDLLEVIAFDSFSVFSGTFGGDVTVNGAFTSQGIDDNASSNAITINSGGNVGIGTATPSVPLQVNGSSQFGNLNTGTGTAFVVGQTDVFTTSTNPLGIGTAGSADLKFYTASTERMRINYNGTIGLGGISSIGTVQMGMRINGQSWFCVWEDDVGNDKFRVLSDGSAYNNGTWGTISDIKLKENIVDATPKLNDLMKIKVRNFNFIGDDNKHIGLIAQELEEVFPNLVQENYDHKEIEITKTDENGNTYTETEKVIDEENTTKRVKTSALLHIAIKAIQEQQQQIEELKVKVAALENA